MIISRREQIHLSVCRWIVHVILTVSTSSAHSSSSALYFLHTFILLRQHKKKQKKTILHKSPLHLRHRFTPPLVFPLLPLLLLFVASRSAGSSVSSQASPRTPRSTRPVWTEQNQRKRLADASCLVWSSIFHLVWALHSELDLEEDFSSEETFSFQLYLSTSNSGLSWDVTVPQVYLIFTVSDHFNFSCEKSAAVDLMMKSGCFVISQIERRILKILRWKTVKLVWRRNRETSMWDENEWTSLICFNGVQKLP